MPVALYPLPKMDKNFKKIEYLGGTPEARLVSIIRRRGPMPMPMPMPMSEIAIDAGKSFRFLD